MKEKEIAQYRHMFLKISGIVEKKIGQQPLTEAVNDPTVAEGLGLMQRYVHLFTKLRRCIWCNSKVKIRKLSPEDHQVFKQSALCTLCEGEHAETKSFHKHKIGEIYNDNRTIN